MAGAQKERRFRQNSSASPPEPQGGILSMKLDANVFVGVERWVGVALFGQSRLQGAKSIAWSEFIQGASRPGRRPMSAADPM